MAVNAVDALTSFVRQPFEECARQAGSWPIIAGRPEILQMNLGYLCNQACRHCHHVAGPDRTELMSKEVMAAALDFADTVGISEFDLTGGAPELNPHLRWLVEQLTERGATITERCNLTVLQDPRALGIGEFLARHRVKIIASLPCHRQAVTDDQRGAGVYEASIEGLRSLNAIGYGLPGGQLELLLVHNPAGPTLPPRQDEIAHTYRKQLRAEHGVEFTRLIALANIPCGRFAQSLREEGDLESYMALLHDQFVPDNLKALMCLNLLSLRWDGRLYDCDFNQALDLPILVADDQPADIHTARLEDLEGRHILCLNHCYGCAAGQGSSCSGALID